MQTKSRSVRTLKTTRLGTLLRTAIESSGEYASLTGNCRRYLASLNKTQRVDPDKILSRLIDELRICDDAGALWITQTVATLIPQKTVKPNSNTVPDVSTIGTQIRRAIESAAEYTMTCGPCIVYLNSLNKSLAPDIESVTQKLLTEIQIPIEFRRKIGPRTAMESWLRSIVESTINASTGPS